MKNRLTKLTIILMVFFTVILSGCSPTYPKISTVFGSIKIKKVVFDENLNIPPPEGYRWLVIYFNDGINGEQFDVASKNVELCPAGGINKFCLSRSYIGKVPGKLFLGFEVKPGDLLLTFGNYFLRWPENEDIFIEIPLE